MATHEIDLRGAAANGDGYYDVVFMVAFEEIYNVLAPPWAQNCRIVMHATKEPFVVLVNVNGTPFPPFADLAVLPYYVFAMVTPYVPLPLSWGVQSLYLTGIGDETNTPVFIRWSC